MGNRFLQINFFLFVGIYINDCYRTDTHASRMVNSIDSNYISEI